MKIRLTLRSDWIDGLMRHAACFLVFCSVSLSAFCQSYRSETLDSLKKAIDGLYEEQLMVKSKTGFIAKSLKSGQVLYAHHAAEMLSTASCMKLVTTAAALDRWGANHHFITGFYSDSAFDGRVVRGNLYIKGYGDPYFTTEILFRTVYHLKALGLQRIEGDLIADDTYLLDTPNAETNDRAYSAMGSALGYNFNTVVICIRPGTNVGDSAVVFTEPISNLIQIVNFAKTADSGSGIGVNNFTVSASYTGEKMRIMVSGTMGIDEEELAIYKRVNEPAKFAAQIIRETFELFGIPVKGQVRLGRTPKNVETIAEPASNDLSAVIAGINKWSNNYAATQLLMNMGADEFGPPGTDDKGIRAIQPFLDKVGIRSDQITMIDGSGLDIANKTTPEALLRVLEYMATVHTLSPEYLASFSIAGVDGTERKRFQKNGGPQGRARLKIGYLHGVSGLAGYIDTIHNDRIAFVMLTNDFPKEYYESVKRIEDRLCALLGNL